VKYLSVLFDSECGLCRRCRDWLSRQPAFIPMVFIPLQSPDLEKKFPGITALHPNEQLLVISDSGEVYRGGSAWILCLWALREYRGAALRLATPQFRPLARLLCEHLSRHRSRISDFLCPTGLRPGRGPVGSP
jgi:predicted DCC family thiol-disulfide oxidoreductase YuxK